MAVFIYVLAVLVLFGLYLFLSSSFRYRYSFKTRMELIVALENNAEEKQDTYKHFKSQLSRNFTARVDKF